MNPSKIELPENLIKKLETETNILNNINGLIQGKNLIVDEDHEINNKKSHVSNICKISNNDNVKNLPKLEECENKYSDEDHVKTSNFNIK